MMSCYPPIFVVTNRFLSMHRVYFVKPVFLEALWKRLDAYLAVLQNIVCELDP